jgi:hypothetical protein
VELVLSPEGVAVPNYDEDDAGMELDALREDIHCCLTPQPYLSL